MEFCKEKSTGDSIINFQTTDTYLVWVLTFFASCRIQILLLLIKKPVWHTKKLYKKKNLLPLFAETSSQPFLNNSN